MISTKFALLWNLRWATGGTVSTSTGGHRKICGCHRSGPPVGLRWNIGDHWWTAVDFQPGDGLYVISKDPLFSLKQDDDLISLKFRVLVVQLLFNFKGEFQFYLTKLLIQGNF